MISLLLLFKHNILITVVLHSVCATIWIESFAFHPFNFLWRAHVKMWRRKHCVSNGVAVLSVASERFVNLAFFQMWRVSIALC
jgi:hypothetical protein